MRPATIPPMFASLVALVAGFVVAGSASAAAWKIQVAAGDVDRSSLPVRARIFLPETAVAGGAARLRLADGSQVEGQLVPPPLLEKAAKAPPGTVARDVVFMLPKLPAGDTALVEAELVSAAPQAQSDSRIRWAEEPGAVALLLDGKPLLRYEMPSYDESSEAERLKTYKPFHHVFDPVSGTRLTKGDGGQFTHHRGIFFGYNRISHGEGKKTSSDCWHCKRPARQEHRSVLLQEAGTVEAVQRVGIDWIGSDKSRILGEVRELTAVPVSGGTVIEFASRLEASAPVRLDGDPQHSGVHFRASNEVHDSTKGQTYYLRPGVKAKPGEYRNWPADKTYVNAPWHAASFVVGGQRYTVLRVNRPANAGEARMSERDYGRFGSYFEYELTPDAPLEVGYRFWVQSGELSLDEAARIAADYARPAQVTVSGGN